MVSSLSGSYSYCERLARREAGNFYHAFRMLSRQRRQGMCALYAFMRVTDDLGDCNAPLIEKQRSLSDWRRRLDMALNGNYSHPLHPAFHHTVQIYGISTSYLEAVLNGVSRDLEPVFFDKFNDLYGYCYQVASAVGLACIHIWGFTNPRAQVYAEMAGIGFQLTNILRDLGEDAARGRIYLPREDLDHFNYTVEELQQSRRSESFQALMRFEVNRARNYYRDSRPLARYLDSAGNAVFQIMTETYSGILKAIERNNYDVFSRRIGVTTWRKMCLTIKAIPVCWGLS